MILGIQFKDNPEYAVLDKIRHELLANAQKDVARLLMRVKVYQVEDDVLILRRDFIAADTVGLVFMIMLGVAFVPMFIWNVNIPFFIVYGLYVLWLLLNTPRFNYLMFKLMLRKMGIRTKTRQL